MGTEFWGSERFQKVRGECSGRQRGGGCGVCPQGSGGRGCDPRGQVLELRFRLAVWPRWSSEELAVSSGQSLGNCLELPESRGTLGSIRR